MNSLVQNTPEWEEMRKGKIGASDAPIIMEESRYKTPYQLWEEKLGLSASPKTNFAMQRGHDLEEPARKLMEEMTGISFRPAVKFHPTIPWMMASLDCLSVDENIIGEIKNLKKEDHEKAKEGIIAPMYFTQVQHAMKTCEVDECLYFSYYDGEGVIVKVPRDQKYINKMMKKEEAFYNLITNLEPPPLTSRDYRERKSKEWKDLVQTWLDAHIHMKKAKEQEESIRKTLIELCQGQSSICEGVQIRRIIERGRVNYSQIPELKHVNLNDYRKKSSEKWRFTRQNSD